VCGREPVEGQITYAGDRLAAAPSGLDDGLQEDKLQVRDLGLASLQGSARSSSVLLAYASAAFALSSSAPRWPAT